MTDQDMQDAPKCEKCGLEITTGMMAALCPQARQCVFWPHTTKSGEEGAELLFAKLWMDNACEQIGLQIEDRKRLERERDEARVYAVALEKAVEFAEHLGTTATRFMDAINAVDEARERHEEAEPGADAAAAYDVMYAAEEIRSDLWSTLRDAIYEFEKRRDRAALAKNGEAGEPLGNRHVGANNPYPAGSAATPNVTSGAPATPPEATPVGGAFGWKVVPIEPTHAQLYAAGVTPEPIIEAAPGEPEYVPVAKMIYRAMLAAAPGFPGPEGWTQQMVAFLHGHGAQHYEPVPGEGLSVGSGPGGEPIGAIDEPLPGGGWKRWTLREFKRQNEDLKSVVAQVTHCHGLLREALSYVEDADHMGVERTSVAERIEREINRAQGLRTIEGGARPAPLSGFGGELDLG